MPIYTLNFQDYAPNWVMGQPINGNRINDVLSTLKDASGNPLVVTSVDPDGRTGKVIIEASADPRPLLVGMTFGPTADELAYQAAVTEYKAAVVVVRALTATSGVAAILSGVQRWERATTTVFKLINSGLNDAI